MQSLPFEILRQIFTYLETEELLECQHACKNWYNASLELLYSNIQIFSKNGCFKYVRTISNHPQLGHYLRQIGTASAYIWDECNLLNGLAEYCPNLLKFKSNEQSLNFWIRISYLAREGRFSRLQCLPRSRSSNLESYIYTTLFFKESLTSLSIQDESSRFGLNLNRLVAYQTLQDQIHQFKNLQSVKLSYHSNRQLSYLDAFIEGCPYLKNIDLQLSICITEKVVVGPAKIIKPRPHIQELLCTWPMIDNEIEIKYLMQKFPSLQSLKIYLCYRSNLCPTGVVGDLVRYILAVPSFQVAFSLRHEDFRKAWVELMQMNDICSDVTFKYSYADIVPDTVYMNIKNDSLAININTTEVGAELLLPTEFFSQLGKMIRSLNLTWYSLEHGTHWISQIIQLCPSLQQLSLKGPRGTINASSDLRFQQTELKKLSILICGKPDEYIDLLKNISLNLPNIKYLQLKYLLLHPWDEPVVIHVPSLRLDQLTAICKYHRPKKIRIYIRLNANSNVTFYIGDQNGRLSEIGEELYNKRHSVYSFNITCQSLKEFVIGSIDRSFEIKWVF